MTARNIVWGLERPNGHIVLNILEATEMWVWALFYSRQYWKRKQVHPSQVPPDFITCCKAQGYRAVKLSRTLDSY